MNIHVHDIVKEIWTIQAMLTLDIPSNVKLNF